MIRLVKAAVAVLAGASVLAPFAAGADRFSDQGIAAFYARRDYDGALRYERAWVAAEPRNADAWFNLGGTLALQFHDYSSAVNAFSRSLADDPTYAPGWEGLGSTYFHQRQYRKAADAYRRLTQLAPSDPLAWLNQSASLSFAGDNKASVQALWDGIHHAGSSFNSAMWFHYAEALRNMNQTRPSIDVYRRALQLDIRNGPAWNDLGSVLAELGDYSQAKQCYERAAALNVQLARENLVTLQQMIDEYNASLQRASRNQSSAYARAMAQHNHDILFYGHDVLPGDRP